MSARGVRRAHESGLLGVSGISNDLPRALANTPQRSGGGCEQAAWLGFEIDQAANNRGGPTITKEGSKTSSWVIPTDEDVMIARHSWALLRAPLPSRKSRFSPIGHRPSWGAPHKFFPIFLLGALFGKLMEDSGSVEAIARFMTEKLGPRRASLAVVLAGVARSRSERPSLSRRVTTRLSPEPSTFKARLSFSRPRADKRCTEKLPGEKPFIRLPSRPTRNFCSWPD
jgi:hypothetical protein